MTLIKVVRNEKTSSKFLSKAETTEDKIRTGSKNKTTLIKDVRNEKTWDWDYWELAEKGLKMQILALLTKNIRTLGKVDAY